MRHTIVMQIAKIRLADGREELCLLRDVSPDGLRAQIYVLISAGERIEVEMRTGHTITGTVAWVEDDHVGVAFDAAMPMSALLAHCSFDDRVGRPRPPRLAVDIRGLLRVDHEERVVHIGNISQAGMQITAPASIHHGSRCAIALPGLAPRPATVRWSRGDQVGLMLADPFDYAEFAEWRAVLAAAA